jgi:hypothetical protein
MNTGTHCAKFVGYIILYPEVCLPMFWGRLTCRRNCKAMWLRLHIRPDTIHLNALNNDFYSATQFFLILMTFSLSSCLCIQYSKEFLNKAVQYVYDINESLNRTAQITKRLEILRSRMIKNMYFLLRVRVKILVRLKLQLKFRCCGSQQFLSESEKQRNQGARTTDQI